MKILIFTILLFFQFATAKSDCELHSNYLDTNSYVRITGDTNINDFSCIYNNELLKYLPNCCLYDKNGNIKLVEGIIEFPVSSFDCGNSMMNKDFKKLLKEEVFSSIEINIINLRKASSTNKDVAGEAQITINIAGVKNKYMVEYFQEKTQDTFLVIKGKKEINIKDFNLEPPTKFMGLIKVKEHVMIEFEFRILAQPEV